MGWMDAFFQNAISILWAGVAQLPWKKLNFTGDGVTVSSNPATQSLDISIPGADSAASGPLVVVAATTAAITLSGGQPIDDITVSDGAFVLVKDQADASENGVYVVGTPWTRAAAMDEDADLRSGRQVHVRRGTDNGGRTFKLDGAGPFTLDSTDLVFTTLLDTVAAALQIGGSTPSIAFIDEDGVPALLVLPDSDGGTTIAATDDVTVLSIGLLTNDSPGTDSRLGLRLSGGDGRPANPSDPNNDGRPARVCGGKAGTGGTGTAKPGPLVITDDSAAHPPATVGMIRTGNPGDWDADGVLLAAMNADDDGNVALVSLDADDGAIFGATAPKVDAGTLHLSPLGGSDDDWDRLLDPATGLLTLAAGRTVVLRKDANPWRADTEAPQPALASKTHIVVEAGATIESTLTAAMSYPGNYLFAFIADANTQSGTLAATPAIGDTTLSVSITAKPTVGHFLQVIHGLSCTTFEVIAASGGASPWSVTIDRPTNLPWQSGDVVDEYSSRPADCALEFSGADVTGGGNQYVQGVRADRIRVTGLRQNASGGYPTNVVGFDNSCRWCTVEDCSAVASSSPAMTGFYCQSNEFALFRRCTVSNNILGYGVQLLDCVGSIVEDCFVERCGNGITITSFGVGPDLLTSFGSFDCVVRGGRAVACTNGVNVGLSGPATNCRVEDFSAVLCTGFGIYVGAEAVNTTIARCDVTGSATGVIFQSGSTGNRVRDLIADGCTAKALGTGGDLDAEGVFASVNYAADGVISCGGAGPWRLRKCALTQGNANGYGIYIPSSGDADVDGVTVDGQPVCGIWVNGAATVRIRNFRVNSNSRGGGDQGVVVTAGGTVILGGGVDLSNCSVPFVISGGTVTGRFDVAIANIAMTTANKTATWAEYAADTLIISGTLGAGRDLILPIYSIPQVIKNGADQTVTVKGASGTGVAITAGTTKRVVFDGTNYVEV
jgi:hypothetical protein